MSVKSLTDEILSKEANPMRVAGGSNIGQRKDNEDRYDIRSLQLANGCTLHFLIVADGMGGHEHGQLASRAAVEQFNLLDENAFFDGFDLDDMQTIFHQANSRIYAVQEHLHDGIIGTTLTATAIESDQLYLGHIGDSRCYLYRDGVLEQLSEDHTYYAELIRQGQEIASGDEKQKNMLMKALGPEEYIDGQYISTSLKHGDMLLLCTDGFYNLVSEETMMDALDRVIGNQDLIDSVVEELLQVALAQGARDNLTLILYLHESEITSDVAVGHLQTIDMDGKL